MTNKTQFNSLQEWKAVSPTEYNNARYQGLLSDLAKYYGWVYHIRIKYSKELCMKEALNYNSTGEWRKNSRKTYNAARRNGWYDECITHMAIITIVPGYWNDKDRCMKDALNYDYRAQWWKNSNSAYTAAKRYGWFDECTAHMISDTLLDGYWNNKDRCMESALKYKTRAEWAKNDSGAVGAARRYGWLDECTAHMPSVRKVGIIFTEEMCVKDAQEYPNRTQWAAKSSAAYKACIKNGWENSCYSHMKRNKPTNYWNDKDRCMKDAQEYPNKTQWMKKSSGAYNAARKNGWVDECTAHMKKNNKVWTKKSCVDSALTCSTLAQWRKKYDSAYNAARRNGWLDECTAHIPKKYKPRGYWTEKRCMEDALKYPSRSQWKKYSASAYTAARKNGWIDECCKHMIKNKK